MNTPKKYFRICYFDHNNVIRPLETHQFDRHENNWFESEAEAEKFICDHFIDSQQDRVSRVDMTLIVLPIWTVQFKK